MSSPKDRTSLVPLLLVGMGILLMLGSVIWVIRSSPKTSTTAAELPATVSSPRIPYPDIPRVRLGDAKAAYNLNQAVFIDTRGEPYFSSGHIPGALSMTEVEVSARLDELDPNAWIIPYCT